MRVVNQQVPTPFRDIDVGTVLRLNLLEFAEDRGAPALAHGEARHGPRRRSGARSAPMDIALGLAEDLPSGLYSGSGIEHYVRTVLSDPDRTDDFRALENELYLAATDLDTCERIVFGADGLGRRADLPRGARLDGAADGLQARRASTTASSSTAASSRRRTSTSPSTPARSSSSSSTRSSPT